MIDCLSAVDGLLPQSLRPSWITSASSTSSLTADQSRAEANSSTAVNIGIPSHPSSPDNVSDSSYVPFNPCFASTSRSCRTTSHSGVRYTKDGNITAVHRALPIMQPEVFCPLSDLAHTVLEDRQRRVNIITGDSTKPSVNHSDHYEVVDLST